MGNLLQESGLSPTNAQDLYMNTSKLRDYSYNYSVKDGIGYGIMQWTYGPRKQGLADMAITMGSTVSDRNVQFAYMRKELSTNCSQAWAQIKNSNDIANITKIFREKIEGCGSESDSDRLLKANTVFNTLKNY